MENVKHSHLLNIAKISETAKKDGWVVQYVPELDYFYWTKPDISDDAKLTKFLSDFALYITPAGNIEGLFIEYAKNNFVEHNEIFEPLFDNLTEESENNILTIPQDQQDKFQELLECMANKVLSETVVEVEEKGLNIQTAFA